MNPDSGPIPESRIPNPDSGRVRWWRTLEERADDPAFQERLRHEFPSQIESISDPVERRAFLRLMGASLALAGVTACTRQPAEAIVPYVRQPEELVPGRPLFFATAMAIGGVATGLLVESHEGRPTKIEGNPLHPGSLGAADLFAQAAVLGLYDPDRSQTLTNLGEIRPWSAFLGAIRAVLNAQQLPFEVPDGGLEIRQRGQKPERRDDQEQNKNQDEELHTSLRAALRTERRFAGSFERELLQTSQVRLARPECRNFWQQE